MAHPNLIFSCNALKNLTDKPTQVIGQTFSDLWQLVLGGRVAFAVEKKKMKYAYELEAYRQSLEAKVAAIPDGKLVDPPLQIVAQSLDDSKYCVEQPELREMFANLIANSMNADYSNILHPSFSKIIQQLSPLDAQMLKIMYERQPYGGIAIVDDDVIISTSSDVSANLIDADSNNLYMRQKSGIEKTLKI